MKEFNSVIGYDKIKEELYILCDIIKNTDKYKKLGVTIPKGLLLYGKPGVGKTTMAKCFIEATGVKNVYTIRKNKDKKELIKHIKDTFKMANQNNPCIIFLDDFDKFSNEDYYHRNTQEYVTIQSCIDECCENVFVIGTANDINKLPNSLLRVGRFDNKFEFGNPCLKDAKKIIKYYLKNKQVEDNLNLLEIAKILNGGSCADLEAIINLAGIYAGNDRREKISQNDIIKAALRIIMEAPESLSNKNKDIIERIAVHEAGHAVMLELLSPNNLTIVSILQYESSSGGITSTIRDPDYFLSKLKQENDIKIGLAGRAATEIVYGILDMGSDSDYNRAENILRDHIDNDWEFDFGSNYNDSEEINKRNQIICQIELKRLYDLTKRILIENRAFLDEVTKELLNKDFLVRKDMDEVKSRVNIIPVSQIYVSE